MTVDAQQFLYLQTAMARLGRSAAYASRCLPKWYYAFKAYKTPKPHPNSKLLERSRRHR